MSYDDWPAYVPVAQRRAKAQREMKKLRKKGVDVCPIEIEGRKIVRTFWGEAWCNHLEAFSDYANRLPRGKRYVRNGSVCHLAINKGKINAIVSGSALYDIQVAIKPLQSNRWKAIQKRCMGQIGSLLELLEGKLSDSVMEVVTDPKTGLFPQSNDIQLDCNCPDWASLCKHLAAVLYGVGALLDKQPELLFKLRGVDHEALVSTDIALPTGTGSGKRRRLDNNIGDVFGIEFDASTDINTRSDLNNISDFDNSTDGLADEIVPSKSKCAQTKENTKSAVSKPKVRKPAPKKSFNPTSTTVSRLRKRLGMNCAQFAQLIGVSSGSITLWENKGGRLNLRERSKQALATAMDLEKSDAWERLGL